MLVELVMPVSAAAERFVLALAAPAQREIDGHGAVLAPGFIDTHSHDDGAFFRYPGMEFKLGQGRPSGICAVILAIASRLASRAGGK